MDASQGIDLRGVQFRVDELGRLAVEISYAERRDQSNPNIAKFEVIVFDAEEAPEECADLIETLETLVDLVLSRISNPPATKPGRQQRDRV